jgi:AcrR family transcriptional regulator/DNA-binding MarR family transcriptional regulator
MQRALLLNAAVACIDELGYTGATVAHIAARARVSRKTFYDLFAGREDCLLAILQDTVNRIAVDLASSDSGGLPWRECVRMGLWEILSVFDSEPAIARVCVVQSARGSQRVLEYREEILARLAGVIDEGRHESARAVRTPPLTAEGLVGAVLAIVYKRLLKGTGDVLLTDLLGELMSMIVLPYLGPGMARKECDRALPTVLRTPSTVVRDTAVRVAAGDPLKNVPMRITYRTARVLQAAAAHPGASNRLIGDLAETYDQGQVSKLLGRLQRLGLIVNAGGGQAKGEPNAWSLTPLGQSVTQQLALDITTNSQKTEGSTS